MIVQAWTNGEGDLCDICWANIELLATDKKLVENKQKGTTLAITFIDKSVLSLYDKEGLWKPFMASYGLTISRCLMRQKDSIPDYPISEEIF